MLSRIKIQILSAFLLATFSGAICAAKDEPLQQNEFMFAARLDEAATALRRVAVDATLLQHMQTPGAHDVRVFDADGNRVPALLRQTKAEIKASEHALNFFPLYSDKSEDVHLSSTDVERDASGLVVAIHSRQGQADSQSILTGYVIDQTAYVNEQLSELEFDWRNDQQLMLSMRIETSSDLSHWTTLERAAVIAHFKIDEQMMRRNVVKLSARAQAYLRLTFLNNVENFALKKVSAHYNRTSATDYSWLSLGPPRAVAVDGREYYEFVLPGRVAPALLKFSFAANAAEGSGVSNGLISGQLASLNAQNKWIPRQSINQYRIVLANTELESDPVRLVSTDRRWRFEPVDGSQLSATKLPEIKLAYPKYELIFMAQGRAPYSIAWGKADAGRQSNSLQTILSAASAADIATVAIQSAEQLAEIPLLEDPDALNWRKWLLFAVLLIAVLAAGRMAYQLFKEMNA